MGSVVAAAKLRALMLELSFFRSFFLERSGRFVGRNGAQNGTLFGVVLDLFQRVLPRDSLENEGSEAPEPLLEACKNALRFRVQFRDVFLRILMKKGLQK